MMYSILCTCHKTQRMFYSPQFRSHFSESQSIFNPTFCTNNIIFSSYPMLVLSAPHLNLWSLVLILFTLLARCSSFQSLYLRPGLDTLADVILWDEGVPGFCAARCLKEEELRSRLIGHAAIVVANVMLSRSPTADQRVCEEAHACPVWDGRGLYLQSFWPNPPPFYLLVTDDMPAPYDPLSCCSSMNEYIGKSPGLVSIRETCRIAHQIEDVGGRKRCIISLGGWGDWAAIGTEENARRIARLLARLVRYTFADGVDLNFDHLSLMAHIEGREEEHALLAVLAGELRARLDEVSSQVYVDAAQDYFWFNRTLLSLQQSEAAAAGAEPAGSRYLAANMAHMQVVLASGVPRRVSISWTTRINAFVPDSAHANYAALVVDGPEAQQPQESQEGKGEEEGEATSPLAVPQAATEKASSSSSSSSVGRAVAGWFGWTSRPRKPAATGKPTAQPTAEPTAAPTESEALVQLRRSLSQAHATGDNEGRMLWPQLSTLIDEVIPVAHLQHITDPPEDADFVMERLPGETQQGQGEEDHLAEQMRRGLHARLHLNLSAVAANFVQLGGVPAGKLRVVLQPSCLLPREGALVDARDIPLVDPSGGRVTVPHRHPVLVRAAENSLQDLPPLPEGEPHVFPIEEFMQDQRARGPVMHLREARLYLTTTPHAPHHRLSSVFVVGVATEEERVEPQRRKEMEGEQSPAPQA
jgi:hypothetical protein